mmetsp:Transcript_78344/g.196686  ORF Transcript_78344/g.196686 Transcript_78344/m.196686 type:complete len:158 (-) Transcript_78344:13-486(-)
MARVSSHAQGSLAGCTTEQPQLLRTSSPALDRQVWHWSSMVAGICALGALLLPDQVWVPAAGAALWLVQRFLEAFFVTRLATKCYFKRLGDGSHEGQNSPTDAVELATMIIFASWLLLLSFAGFCCLAAFGTGTGPLPVGAHATAQTLGAAALLARW